MKSFLRTSTLVLAGALMLAQTTAPALAADAYNVVRANRNQHDWTTYGDVYQKGELTILSEFSTEKEYAYKDFDLRGMSGNYIILTAYTMTPDGRQSGDITGQPYIYGYLFGRDGHIDEYLQGQNMRHSTTRADGEWELSYGIFRREPGQDSVRMFLNQAARNGTFKDGREAVFYSPQLMLTNSYPDALDQVAQMQGRAYAEARRNYQALRPGGTAANTSPDPYVTGPFRYALVKMDHSPTIWLVDYTKGTRHVFVNEAIYKTYDPTWERFRIVSSQWLGSYDEALPALPIHVHVRADGDDTIWWSTGQSLARPHPATIRSVMQLPSWYQQLYNM